MSDDPTPLPETVSKSRRLAAAFLSVFGTTGRRSADQRLVIAHLRDMCGRDTTVFKPDSTGRFDPLRAAQIDGAQSQFLIIKRQIEKATEFAKPKKTVTAKK